MSPITIDKAVQLAKEHKEKNDWSWPRYIVEYLEESLEIGSSISFVFEVYEQIGVFKSNPVFNMYLSRAKSLCKQTVESKTHLELSEEVWYDDSNDSAASRGLTRILSASNLLNRTEKFRYRVEIASAIRAACDDESFSFDKMEDVLRTHVENRGLGP